MDGPDRSQSDDTVDGLLRGKRYLIHDRDPLFTAEFLSTLAEAGTESVKLPPRLPNLNSYAERFVSTIKESSLERMILFGSSSRIIMASEIIRASAIFSFSPIPVSPTATGRSDAEAASAECSTTMIGLKLLTFQFLDYGVRG